MRDIGGQEKGRGGKGVERKEERGADGKGFGWGAAPYPVRKAASSRCNDSALAFTDKGFGNVITPG
jgi:hypothetical protein